jgi:hypothetical protein
MHVFKSGSMCEVTNSKSKVPELPWPLFLPAPFHLVHDKNKCMMYVLRLILMSRCLDPAYKRSAILYRIFIGIVYKIIIGLGDPEQMASLMGR